MTTQSEFFLAHQVDGQLTDEQMAEMLNLPEGDTGATPEIGKPNPEPAKTVEAAPVENVDKTTVEETPADPKKDGAAPTDPTPVVLAKDGVHTIPYEKLVEARDGEKHWKAQAETAQAQLAALQAEAAQRAEAGAAPTKTDNAVAVAAAAIEEGADPAIFGDFSEGDLAKGIHKLVAMRVEQATAALRGELTEAVTKPIKEQQALTAQEAHFKTIYTAHPDADSVFESTELADWIGKQPSIVRDAYQGVLKQGSAEQVVELFSAFKAATVKTPVPPVDPGVTAAAKAAIAAAKSPVPTSLSEIPAGSAAHHDEATAMLEMSSTSLLTKFDGKSPEQIQAMLNRVL